MNVEEINVSGGIWVSIMCDVICKLLFCLPMTSSVKPVIMKALWNWIKLFWKDSIKNCEGFTLLTS